MGARAEVEGKILLSWVDERVARWVISKLPLLECGYTNPVCPVYDLSLNAGLSLVNSPRYAWDSFCTSNKIVMSGGFEGTEGHLKVVREMHETRNLTNRANSPIVLMLEPDSYIQRQKGREPLVNFKQRVQLWSTSGLIDAIITLPERPDDITASDFYDHKIHNLIAPATWCVNVENPHFFEIMNRGEVIQVYDLIRLFVHHIEAHTSFLDSTRELGAEEVKEKLYNYLLNLVLSNRYTTTGILSSDEETRIFFERIAEGL